MFHHPRLHALTACLCLALATPAIHAQADAPAAAQYYDLPAAPLADTLMQVARHSGRAVSVAPALVQGRTAPAIKGAYTAEQAMRQALAGSGLELVVTANGTLSAKPAANVTTLQEITVTSTLGNALGEVDGYLATASHVATKTSRALHETSQSVSVVTQEQIRDQGSSTVQQAMRYTPGIYTDQIGASARYDYVVMRGFADGSVDNIYLDGLKTMGDAGTYSSIQIDPYFLERMDIVKGPASVLYGRSAPGGLVALTSKKPVYQPYRQIELGVGNQGHKHLGMDLGGAVDADGVAAYRLVALAQDADTQFEHTGQRRYALAPSLTLNFTDDTVLTLQGYFQNDPEGGYHSGVPADGSLYAHNGRKISRHFFDGERELDEYRRRQTMLGYQLEHRFNDTWSARQNFRYLRSDVAMGQVYGYGWVSEDSSLLHRYYTSGAEDLRAFIVDNMVQADFSTGPFRHTVLAGLDYQRMKTSVDWGYGTAAPLDAFDPVYGNATLTDTGKTLHARSLRQTGVYVQDLIDVGRWRFSLGLRKDWVKVGDDDLTYGVSQAASQSAVSGRAGALYAFDNGVSPYLSYSTSFNPNSYTDEAGRLLEPTEGRQWEAGVKYAPAWMRGSLNAALFHIRQRNVASKEPQNAYYTAFGEIQSRGLELEANLQPSENLSVLAAYTYTDAEYTRALDGTQGNMPNQIPRHMASLWARYQFSRGPAAGLGVGAGVRYVGKLWADTENTLHVPGRTLVDVGVDYDLAHAGVPGASLRLNVNNLFDKDYVASCYSRDFCYFGSERTVRLTLSYQF